ncbi:MAG TPA: lysylphosphatidylglycerol synthase transmembrane domain-containing protein [Solirubrobacteraceae bacterium]|nr:lysylphosphatidylglycerol synthase transmembrane domain-containing protein [Solirubrobacteraceae bacterium]
MSDADSTSADGNAPDNAQLELDEAKATRNLVHGLISLAVLLLLAVGLLLAVPGLHHVGHEIDHMGGGWLALAIGLEILSCVGYIVAFLQVFERAPIRFGARVALTELAFGAAVSLGGAGSIAVGAWLLIERGIKPSRVAERSAVLFLLTSGVNLITLAIAGLGVWVGILPGKRDDLLSLAPGAVGVLVFLAFLAMPLATDRLTDNRSGKIYDWLRVTSETIRATERVMFRWDWRIVGALGYLWFDIAVLWVCFHALGHAPPIATVVLAYQIGYLSNLIPVPGGIGILDGSFVGMFVLYGVNATMATSATIVYHAISLWIPAMWGTGAYLALRRSRNQPLKLRKTRAERREAKAEQRRARARQ